MAVVVHTAVPDKDWVYPEGKSFDQNQGHLAVSNVSHGYREGTWIAMFAPGTWISVEVREDPVG